jgi:hypothetical protein
VVVGLLPLLVVGTAVLVVLGSRFADTAAPLREATGRALATVERSGIGDDSRGVELSWTDEQQVRRTGIVRASGPGRVPAGARVEVRYVPDDPARVYAAGDETSARLRDLAFGLALIGLTLLLAVSVSIGHIARRAAATRRAGARMPVTYARSRRRLLSRSWLVIDDQGRQHWVPVHWEPALTRLLAGTPAVVHGRPGRDRVLAVDVEGATVWQAAGRVRSEQPRGEITMDAPTWSAATARRPADQAASVGFGLARQLRADGAVLVAAPVLGLAWAYMDSSGLAGLLAGTALSAATLLWLPTLLGSDPT